jgi:hypothetical protein
LSDGHIRVSNNATDATNKFGAYTGRHYTNAEESLLAVGTRSDSSNSNILIGGGLGEFNAATNVIFNTAANNTTLAGSERARIDSSGRVLIGTSSWTGSGSPATGIQFTENYTIAAQQGGGISANGVLNSTTSNSAASTTVSLPSGQSFTNFIGTLYVALTLQNSGFSFLAEYRVKIYNDGANSVFTLVDSVDDSSTYAASISNSYNSSTRVITVSASWTGSTISSISASLVGSGAGRL